MAAPSGTGRALVPWVPKERGVMPWLRAAALVALFGVTAGIGGAATYAMRHALPHWGGTDPTMQAALRSTREQVARLGAELKDLKAAEAAKADDGTRVLRKSVEALKAELDGIRASTGAAAGQATARLDRLERDAKADKPAPDAGKDRTADLATRLDRLEKQAAAVTAKPAAAPAEPAKVVATATPAPAKPPAPTVGIPSPVLAVTAPVPPTRPASTVVARTDAPAASTTTPSPLRSWVLRDVYDGLAVVQARGGELREIGPGTYLPGAGEVRSIERRGRNWVVLTSRGVIDAATF